jgi:hypothetical protein
MFATLSRHRHVLIRTLIFCLSLNVLWHVAVIGALLWKRDPGLHAGAIACKTIKFIAHLLALQVLFGYLGPMRTKITEISVSELEFWFTVPESKRGDGIAVIQTPFGKVRANVAVSDEGQEYTCRITDPSQWLLVPVNALVFKGRNLVCDAQGDLCGILDRWDTCLC